MRVEQQRPNVLFIMTDQQHAGMMSCTGNQWLKTPALDRLAASGTRFERAYASNPVCVPSRFSLQTGLMPSAIGMSRNEDSPQAAVTDAMVQQSLGNLLQQAGYETVYGGKVHLPGRMNNLKNIGYRNLTGELAPGTGGRLCRVPQRPPRRSHSFCSPPSSIRTTSATWPSTPTQRATGGTAHG